MRAMQTVGACWLFRHAAESMQSNNTHTRTQPGGILSAAGITESLFSRTVRSAQGRAHRSVLTLYQKNKHQHAE